LHRLALQHAPLLPGHNVGTLNPQALATLAAANSLGQPGAANAALATTATATTEMSIPNDLIGCIIGKGGAKINEIRQLSGATIKISNSEEGSKDRAVAISGTPESINLAQYLINTSMELHKNLTLDPSLSANPNNSTLTRLTSTPMAIPLTQLAAAAAAVPATTLSGALFTTHDLNNVFSSRHIKPMTTKIRAATTSTGIVENGNKTKTERKFTPY
jgi:hypothetical protein